MGTAHSAFFRLVVALSALAWCFSAAALCFAEQPTEQIRTAMERVSEVLQDVSAKRGANKDEAIEKIRRILLPSFDFTEMARRSMGSHWQDLNGRQSEFVAAFAGFVEGSYLSTLESYRGEKIVYMRERVEQDLAEVDTQI